MPTAEPRPARRCLTIRPAISALGLLSLAVAAAHAQQPPAPLPAVIYPDQVQDAAPPAPPMRPPTPMVSPVTIGDGPVTYELVNGVWGFWDRERHFHPAMPTAAWRADERERRRFETGRELSRSVALPNRRTGGIVVRSPPPRERRPEGESTSRGR